MSDDDSDGGRFHWRRDAPFSYIDSLGNVYYVCGGRRAELFWYGDECRLSEIVTLHSGIGPSGSGIYREDLYGYSCEEDAVLWVMGFDLHETYVGYGDDE